MEEEIICNRHRDLADAVMTVTGNETISELVLQTRQRNVIHPRIQLTWA